MIYAIGENAARAGVIQAEKHEWLEKSVSGQEKDQQGEKLPERHRAWRKRKTFQKSALCGWGNRG